MNTFIGQIAKSFGAEVTAVDGHCRLLGMADRELQEQYLVFNLVGGSCVRAVRAIHAYPTVSPVPRQLIKPDLDFGHHVISNMPNTVAQ